MPRCKARQLVELNFHWVATLTRTWDPPLATSSMISMGVSSTTSGSRGVAASKRATRVGLLKLRVAAAPIRQPVNPGGHSGFAAGDDGVRGSACLGGPTLGRTAYRRRCVGDPFEPDPIAHVRDPAATAPPDSPVQDAPCRNTSLIPVMPVKVGFPPASDTTAPAPFWELLTPWMGLFWASSRVMAISDHPVCGAGSDPVSGYSAIGLLGYPAYRRSASSESSSVFVSVFASA